MKNGRICAVEFLQETSDEKRIAEGRELFRTKGLGMGAEGFEIWDHARFVYRFVLDGEAPPVADGVKSPVSWLERLARRLTLKRSLLVSTPAFGAARA